ncbi:unnamed protein product [Trifolium pratense]|uniref:Uncharacterized protein n=1 Tax=Trifolium pratense TaxID=57577 RepID=A0ACB0J0Q9_TRIPR|nr:unnamed protein product [Trifolium pratense]
MMKIMLFVLFNCRDCSDIDTYLQLVLQIATTREEKSCVVVICLRIHTIRRSYPLADKVGFLHDKYING